MKLNTLDLHVILRRAFIKNKVFQNNTIFTNQTAWNEIFNDVFRRAPQGIHDPEWDVLFDAKKGYGMLNIASHYIKK